MPPRARPQGPQNAAADAEEPRLIFQGRRPVSTVNVPFNLTRVGAEHRLERRCADILATFSADMVDHLQEWKAQVADVLQRGLGDLVWTKCDGEFTQLHFEISELKKQSCFEISEIKKQSSETAQILTKLSRQMEDVNQGYEAWKRVMDPFQDGAQDLSRSRDGLRQQYDRATSDLRLLQGDLERFKASAQASTASASRIVEELLEDKDSGGGLLDGIKKLKPKLKAAEDVLHEIEGERHQAAKLKALKESIDGKLMHLDRTLKDDTTGHGCLASVARLDDELQGVVKVLRGTNWKEVADQFGDILKIDGINKLKSNLKAAEDVLHEIEGERHQVAKLKTLRENIDGKFIQLDRVLKDEATGRGCIASVAKLEEELQGVVKVLQGTNWKDVADQLRDILKQSTQANEALSLFSAERRQFETLRRSCAKVNELFEDEGQDGFLTTIKQVVSKSKFLHQQLFDGSFTDIKATADQFKRTNAQVTQLNLRIADMLKDVAQSVAWQELPEIIVKAVTDQSDAQVREGLKRTRSVFEKLIQEAQVGSSHLEDLRQTFDQVLASAKDSGRVLEQSKGHLNDIVGPLTTKMGETKMAMDKIEVQTSTIAAQTSKIDEIMKQIHETYNQLGQLVPLIHRCIKTGGASLLAILGTGATSVVAMLHSRE